jgi:hypothetical protein
MCIVLNFLSVQFQIWLGIRRDVVEINIQFFCEFQTSAVSDVICINSITHSIRDAKVHSNCKEHKGIRKLVFEYILRVLTRPKNAFVQLVQFFLSDSV